NVGFFCSLLAPSDAILFQEGVSVKLRLPQFALGSGAQVASSGDIYGSVWENNWLSTWLHNHVVRDIRLGSIEYKNVWRDYGFGDASGYVLTAAINSNADDIVDTVARRPIQKLIGGIWYNVGSV
ncbi:hypothetical protein, partial [Shigella sonnei]